MQRPMPNDRDIQQMIKDLGRAVAQAISTSDDVNEVVRRIRHHGFSLSLVLNCEQEGGEEAKLELTPRKTPVPPAGASSSDSGFRLGTTDVAWLRSLGIDATRKTPRRRGG